MKIGLPRQNTLITCPSAIGEISTSIGAPAAIVEASGFICEINGTNVARVPIAPTAPVAIKRKSRRVGSAEDIVVTLSVLSRLVGSFTHAANRQGSLHAPQKAPRQRRANRPRRPLGKRR